MKIRAYKDTDKDAVISLWNERGLATSRNDPARDIELKMRVDPDLFLVGVIETELVTTVMAGYEGHRGWINYLAVALSQRSNGYGREIMLHAERLLQAKGCPKVNLQVRTSNKAVIEFYNTLGYSDDDVVSLGKRFK